MAIRCHFDAFFAVNDAHFLKKRPSDCCMREIATSRSSSSCGIVFLRDPLSARIGTKVALFIRVRGAGRMEILY
jgi:hypothetical protein